MLPLLLRTRYGWIGVLIILLIAAGSSILGVFSGPKQGVRGEDGRTDPEATMVQFVSFVLDDTQRAWSEIFAARGASYRNAKLVLFTNATQTSCGVGRTATGPFYCPADEKVYIDLSFYRELTERFGARGDFAQAYVIAHEIGHHVQKLKGISDRVEGAPRSQLQGASGLSVRLELQADCFAGVWARSTQQRNLLEEGDIEEALGAAAAVGDDRIQRSSTGAVHPETWTHGSAAERASWFHRGFDAGKPEACDTFEGRAL